MTATLPPLIGLGGLLRSGKDAIADHLVAKHGFVKLGMSDVLNDAMLVIDPILDIGVDGREMRYADAIEWHGYVEAKKNPEIRRLLQVFGTEFGRQMIGENVWVDMLERKVDALRKSGQSVVVTGLRYPNEVELIHRAFAANSWWVERGGTPTTGHASETSVTSTMFDVCIFNLGTLGDLYNHIDSLITKGATA